ncbi:hypothetical protein GW756_02865 [bacterium]|nr:hypothetical protein [bacterium]NCQ55541.1 hypothetical protein [Candidatus Parcubacteria bacterium]NCS67552.1 hypothetical protein [Candidatus Peregrinibacteria bacterium]NCS96283.1 hypothetical protein [bacterium]
MNKKITASLVAALGLLMILVGTGAVEGLPLTPPAITGIGFLVIAWAICSHKH